MAGGNKGNSPKTKKRQTQQLVQDKKQADDKRRARSAGWGARAAESPRN